MQNWADMRMFLAIVDAGNLVAASEKVGLSQPTLGRRLTAMEKRLDVSLFVRTGRRMQLTDAGQAIVENARRMQREMLAIERSVDTQSHGLTGEVRITATEGTGTEWLAPELVDFHLRYPDILLNVRVETRALDLLHREADIALRLGRPTQPDLIARHLVQVGFGLYAADSYLARKGAPRTMEELADHRLVGIEIDGKLSMAPGESGLAEDSQQFAFVSNSPAAQVSAARAGFGIAVLSHRWASMHPELTPVLPDVAMVEVDMWLVTHEELRHSARIRAVSDFLVERVVANRDRFRRGGSGR